MSFWSKLFSIFRKPAPQNASQPTISGLGLPPSLAQGTIAPAPVLAPSPAPVPSQPPAPAPQAYRIKDLVIPQGFPGAGGVVTVHNQPEEDAFRARYGQAVEFASAPAYQGEVGQSFPEPTWYKPLSHDLANDQLIDRWNGLAARGAKFCWQMAQANFNSPDPVYKNGAGRVQQIALQQFPADKQAINDSYSWAEDNNRGQSPFQG